MNPDNYIFVDEDYDVIRVYDNADDMEPREFAGERRTVRRALAEAFAEREAARLGCSWGCNYND